MSGDGDRPVILRSPYPDVEIPELSVTEYVIGSAAARGDATAIIDGITGERTTYAELSKRSPQRPGPSLGWAWGKVTSSR